jgi:hypothetical protein
MTSHRWRALWAVAGAFAILALVPDGTRSVHATPSAIVVSDSSDAASCPSALTLRCAIDFANAHAFTTIHFSSSVVAVLLQGPLPVISGNGTWIDGTSVVPRIDGTAALSWPGGSALQINADNVTISNLTIVGIPPGGADIRIQGGAKIKIVYNYLGIRPGATHCTADTDYGVLLDSNASGAADPNGAAYIYGNTISCHASRGIWDYFANYVGIGVDGLGNTIGNKIGTSSDGVYAAGNGLGIEGEGNNLNIRGNLVADNAGAGIRLAFGASHDDIAFNVITHNGGPGIWSGSGSDNRLIGNDIGTDAGGTAALPNGQEGILISAGTGLFLSHNIIAYNLRQGIGVTGSGTQADIQNNEIRNNGGLPIDLGEDGATANGTHFPPGPNNWLNYPVVTLANGTSLFGFTCGNCEVYVYRAIGNPAGPGGGGMIITNVFANSSGQWSTNLPAGLTRADVSFTAADAAGNSSEMSPRPQLFLPLLWR